MCGIVGYWDKTADASAPLGRIILDMLNALDCRGPDSAGVALFSHARPGRLVIKVKLGEAGDLAARGEEVTERIRTLGTVEEAATTGQYLRVVMQYDGDAGQLDRLIEATDGDIEVVSLGRRLEIAKQVGSPRHLDATYDIAAFTGTHGIGHTRLSTESRIDLSHSQPFWAHGYPDLTVVHNGHITNYHKLRRIYEQRGIRFYTENDSEIIGVYLAQHLSQGISLKEAMERSLVDLDGSFCYLAATPDALGFAKDPFALKPLLFTETDTFAAVATEEIALQSAFAGAFEAREAQAKDVRIWQ